MPLPERYTGCSEQARDERAAGTISEAYSSLHTVRARSLAAPAGSFDVLMISAHTSRATRSSADWPPTAAFSQLFSSFTLVLELSVGCA